MKILLREFNAKVQKEDILKPVIRNESLHKISNENLTVKSIMFPHCNIHK
jgi:hypothetical protein